MISRKLAEGIIHEIYSGWIQLIDEDFGYNEETDSCTSY